MDAVRFWKWCLNHLGTIPSYAQDYRIHICTGQNMTPIDIKCTVYTRLLTVLATQCDAKLAQATLVSANFRFSVKAADGANTLYDSYNR